ncbi:MAG: 2-oxo acid dehydrogenase subunit E2 [Herpetosiphon sp.]|nr:2-oxo acid dehydrogenase subunit E2 [Herpetosiphon sp.]
MAKKLEMPKMGYDMTEGTLAKWLKQPGDEVSRGEPIAEVETDKVTIEIEAFESGTLVEHLVKEGETVPVGAPIAMLDDGSDEDEDEAPVASLAPGGKNQPSGEGGESAPDSFRNESAQAETQHVGEGGEAAPDSSAQQVAQGTAPAQQDQTPAGEAQAAEPAKSDQRIIATPAARTVAKEQGVDLASLKGSGPDGRIVRADVVGAQGKPATPASQAVAVGVPAAQPAKPAEKPIEAAQPAAPTQPSQPVVPAVPSMAFAPPAQGASYTEEPLSRLRQTGAKRMVESQQQVPPFFVTAAIEMDAAMELLPRLQEAHGGKISVTELLLKACAVALKKHPTLNSTFAGDKLLVHDAVHVSVAVATENGLLAPVVRNCDSISLGKLSNDMRATIKRVREGKATMEDLQGGTFTVSNLGMYDVTNFIAIISPPQSAILAVGSTIPTPVVRDGQIVIRNMMNVTVSADHRVTDGATVAEFLVELKNLLQNPYKLLL